jgi:radical SAM protein with 4Fe4S-binding SPASM domain
MAVSKAQVVDGFQYFGTLSPKRLYNICKVLFSYFLSKITKENYHKGMPIAISIEPTTSCNLRCPECPSGLRSFSRPIGMLEKDMNKKIVDEMGKDLTYITYYFQGEPYLNKDFTDMVSYANRKNIYTATSTNAHYLNDENCKKTIESGLNRLIISIDGVNQESYGKYRIGGKLDKVIEGTRNIVKWKKEMKSKTPFIMWQFIVFGHNEHEIDEIKALAEEVGVDHLALKSAQIYDFDKGSDLLPKNPKYARYSKAGDSYKIKNGLLNQCWRMWHGCVVTWDGKIVPCCFDKDASYQLGDISKVNFKDIWQGQEYQRFRRLILKSRSNIEICKNCSEGTKVWN